MKVKISKFLQVYVTEMGSKGLNQHDVQMNFVRMVELPLRNRVFELATSSDDWVAFEQALLNEYMLGGLSIKEEFLGLGGQRGQEDFGDGVVERV